MTTIQLRRDTADNWLNANPVLAAGEVGVELDTGTLKVGNGDDEWADLLYFVPGGGGGGGEGMTTEQIQDLVANMFLDGTHTGAGYTYNDTAGVINTTGFSNEQIQDIVATLFTTGDHTGAIITYDDAANKINVEVTGGEGGEGLTVEQVQDVVGAMFTSGTHSGITFTYDDAGNNVDVVVSGGGGSGPTTEELQDVIAAMFTSGSHSNLTVTYNDSSGVLNLSASGGGGGTGPAGPEGPRGYTGAAGAKGDTGSAGDGPRLLGETWLSTNSSALTGTTSQDWSGFTKTVTEGTKSIMVTVDCHIQVSSATSVVVGVLRDGVVVGAWNHPINNVGVAHHFSHNTPILSASAGSHTYKVQLRSTITGVTYTGIADSSFKASLKVFEV